MQSYGMMVNLKAEQENDARAKFSRSVVVRLQLNTASSSSCAW